MESRESMMLFSSWPVGAVEVGVLELLPDLVQEVPARGEISNMVAGWAAFVISRPTMQAFALRHVPDEGAQVSLGREGFGTQVVDAELNRLDADFIESK